jgi:hypothetical protein
LGSRPKEKEYYENVNGYGTFLLKTENYNTG